MTWDSSPRDWRLADEHECGRQRSLWRLDAYFSFEDSHPQKRITESEFRKWRIIEEFTKRKLSYDSDVYNTIRGIFSS